VRRNTSSEMADFRLQHEQRAVPRWPVAFVGYCYGTYGSSRCFISELGENGLKLTTGLPYKVGDEVIAAWIINGEKLQVAGTVRYVCDDGAGLQFLNLCPTERLKILEYLQFKR